MIRRLLASWGYAPVGSPVSIWVRVIHVRDDGVEMLLSRSQVTLGEGGDVTVLLPAPDGGAVFTDGAV